MTDQALREWSTTAARRIIGVLLLVSPLEQVAFDIYTPALPKIAEQFAASNTLVQNTVTAYVLGMALVVVPAGAALALISIGVLDPLTKGWRWVCFPATLATGLMAWLPERSQAPLGWFYVAAAAGLVAVLTVAAKHTSRVDATA
ncbi:hypothetical protein [Mycolicibacterium stellerae]|uniref:hypothetical protein n=1 Tax=Mycolicibacterium stellerae TaxID=2358193 RepID=UPI000F0B0AC3|nr:hypothetical protein [Mycolicibacterium stellerae]